MDTLAQQLWDARKTGFSIPRDEAELALDPVAAYGVQARQVRYSGQTIGGWKLGATAEAALKAIGLDEPFMGPLPAADILQSGAHVGLFPDHTYFAETELTLELSGRLPPRPEPYEPDELQSAIKGWRASVEIVGLRLSGGPAGLGPRIIADGAGHRATILGEWLGPQALETGFPVTLRIGETTVSGGPQNLIWSHPMEALAFIAERQEKLARRLQIGDIVMTGTMTGMTPFRPGSSIEANFGGVTVSATTEEA